MSEIRSQGEWERACQESIFDAQLRRKAAVRRAKRRRFYWLCACVFVFEVALLVALATVLG